jgi:hypothetical protein
VSITIALIILFRVPVSIEIITAILGVVMFALITGILIMGKGKTILASRDERTINKQFSKEIELHVLINEAKNKKSKDIFDLRKKFKKARKDLVKSFAEQNENSDLDDQAKVELNTQYKTDKKALEAEFKKARKELIKKFAIFKGETKKQVTVESRKNNFLKQIFLDIVKFGIFRFFAIGTIYIVIGLVAAITLPVVSGMGITLAIGVVIASVVFITISVPL